MSKLPIRIAVAAAFIPLLVFVTKLGGISLLILVELVVLVGLGEFYRLAHRCGLKPRVVIGLASAAALLLVMQRGTVSGGARLLLLTTVVLLTAGLWSRDQRFVGGTAVTLMGVVYIAFAFGHVLLLRGSRPDGWRVALLPFLVTWSCDTGAYFVGSLWGRRRLAPAVSPRKSWEGASAGMVASVGAAFLARGWFAPWLTVRHCVELAVIIGVAAQVGDFVESRMKREAGLDDASGLVPGHGGVLDRLDSLLFAVPATYYYLWVRGLP
jgi:phosphatidate cytidylyltransferase